MKFILGFFIGLMTGVTIILGPLIAFLAGGVLGMKAAEWADDEPEDSVPAQDMSTTPEETIS